MSELFWIIAAIVLFGLLCIVLITDSAVIRDYRNALCKARKEIAILTLHDDEIRKMYPLAEGRKLMEQAEPRWTEIEEAEEGTNHD